MTTQARIFRQSIFNIFGPVTSIRKSSEENAEEVINARLIHFAFGYLDILDYIYHFFSLYMLNKESLKNNFNERDFIKLERILKAIQLEKPKLNDKEGGHLKYGRIIYDAFLNIETYDIEKPIISNLFLFLFIKENKPDDSYSKDAITFAQSVIDNIELSDNNTILYSNYFVKNYLLQPEEFKEVEETICGTYLWLALSTTYHENNPYNGKKSKVINVQLLTIQKQNNSSFCKNEKLIARTNYTFKTDQKERVYIGEIEFPVITKEPDDYGIKFFSILKSQSSPFKIKILSAYFPQKTDHVFVGLLNNFTTKGEKGVNIIRCLVFKLDFSKGNYPAWDMERDRIPISDLRHYTPDSFVKEYKTFYELTKLIITPINGRTKAKLKESTKLGVEELIRLDSLREELSQFFDNRDENVFSTLNFKIENLPDIMNTKYSIRKP